MPNRECNLTKRVRTDQGLRFCPVVLSVNGRVKPDWVIVNGKEERHTEGAYYIEWRDGSKRIRASVAKDAADANARRLRKEAELKCSEQWRCRSLAGQQQRAAQANYRRHHVVPGGDQDLA